MFVRAGSGIIEEATCEICRRRRAESMHEVKPRSLGGEVSVMNSIAVCGDGSQGCHGFAQRNEFEVVERRFDPQGNGRVWRPTTSASARWLEIEP